MLKYKVRTSYTQQTDYIVLAKNKKEAGNKILEGDYCRADEVDYKKYDAEEKVISIKLTK